MPVLNIQVLEWLGILLFKGIISIMDTKILAVSSNFVHNFPSSQDESVTRASK